MRVSGRIRLDLQLLGQRARQTGVVRLDVQLLDNAIFDDHRVALGAQTAQRRQVDGQIHLLGECTLRIGQHADFAVGAVLLAPGGHHERVVDRHAHDFTGTGRLEGGRLLQIAGQVGL